MSADKLFDGKTSASSDRIHGVVAAMVSWWILRGGLDGIDAVADRCEFETIALKTDDAVGRMVIAEHDYVREMLEAVDADASMSHLLRLIGVSSRDRVAPCSEYVQKVQSVYNKVAPDGDTARYVVRYRMEYSVGRHLTGCGWWKRNRGRIKRARDGLRAVHQVMES